MIVTVESIVFFATCAVANIAVPMLFPIFKANGALLYRTPTEWCLEFLTMQVITSIEFTILVIPCAPCIPGTVDLVNQNKKAM